MAAVTSGLAGGAAAARPAGAANPASKYKMQEHSRCRFIMGDGIGAGMKEQTKRFKSSAKFFLGAPKKSRNPALRGEIDVRAMTDGEFKRELQESCGRRF